MVNLSWGLILSGLRDEKSFKSGEIGDMLLLGDFSGRIISDILLDFAGTS